jgi:hypothetical protein
MPSHRHADPTPYLTHNRAYVRIAVLLMACTSIVLHAQSQTLDKSIIQHYNAGIVARVYDVARSVNLSSTQQNTLARQYAARDSMVASWLSQDRPAREIDSLMGSEQEILSGLLDRAQMNTYQRNKSASFASIAAEGEFAYIKERYDPDSANLQNIRNSLKDKYGFIYQQYLSAAIDKQQAEVAIRRTSRVYDSYNFYAVLYPKRFAGDYIEKVTRIRKMPDSTVQHIKQFFYNSIRSDKYEDWEQLINNATQYYFPDTALFSALYAPQFEKQAYELTAADDYNLIFLHKITRTAYDSVYGLIKEKNYKKAVLQYTYSQYHHAVFDSLTRLTTRYYDSTVEASLIRDGSLLPTTQFAMALKYKDLLQLRPGLVDTLVQEAMYLARQRDSILSIDRYAMIDFGAYEAERLNELLTEDQYNLLLTTKNRYKALVDAQADWVEMEQRGISGEFNKEETIREIADFYLLKYNTWNKLANDKLKQWETLRIIGMNRPKALQVLEPLRWAGNTDKATNNLKVKW